MSNETQFQEGMGDEQEGHQYRIRHHLIIRVSDQLISTKQPHLQALAKCNDVLYCHLLDPFEYDADPTRF